MAKFTPRAVISATPQNQFLGGIADALTSAREYGNRYAVSPWVPLLGGTGVGDFWLAKAPEEVRDWSYGDAPVHIPEMSRLPQFKKDRKQQFVDAAFLASSIIPAKNIVKPVAKAAGKEVAEAIYRGIDSGNPLLAGAAPMYVVKNPGGNWVEGSIDKVTSRLKKPLLPNILGDHDPRVVAEALGTTADDVLRQADPSALAINRWLDTQLTTYINNKLGTVDDPVRHLADQFGILHYDPIVAPMMDTYAQAIRKTAGMPIDPVSTTNLGRRYENTVDPLFDVDPYYRHAKIDKDLTGESADHYLRAVGGEFAVKNREAIASRLKPWAGEELGLHHLTDELMNAISPTSNLPQQLRLKPTALKNLSVPQAVELVHKINRYRAEQARLVEEETLKANLLQKPFKEYDNGWQWAELPDADPQAPDDLKLITNIGCQGGWCTKEQSSAVNYGSRAQGNTLYALFDPTGRPHAQVHTIDNRTAPPSITQIMPFSNDWGSQMVADFTERNPKYREEIEPLLQNFIRSRDWDRVHVDALSNAGLRTPSALWGSKDLAEIRKAGINVDKYLTKDDFTRISRTMWPNDPSMLSRWDKVKK